MKQKALLDTNFFIYAIRHKVRVVQELRENFGAEVITISSVIKELERAKERGGELGKEAGLALQMIQKEGIKVILAEKSADDELAKNSKEYLIATNDKALRERIKNLGGRAIYIRKKAFIEEE